MGWEQPQRLDSLVERKKSEATLVPTQFSRKTMKVQKGHLMCGIEQSHRLLLLPRKLRE